MLLRTPAPEPGSRVVTFHLPSDHPAGRISVVGSFNGWLPGVHGFVVDGAVQRVSVTLPATEEITFRYLGQWWFDDPDADWIDDQGSHLAPETQDGAARAADASAHPAGAGSGDPGIGSPRRAEGHTTLSPAEYAVEVARKRRKKAEEAALKAADKARRKARKVAAKLERTERRQIPARRVLRDPKDRDERA